MYRALSSFEDAFSVLFLFSKFGYRMNDHSALELLRALLFDIRKCEFNKPVYNIADSKPEPADIIANKKYRLAKQKLSDQESNETKSPFTLLAPQGTTHPESRSQSPNPDSSDSLSKIKINICRVMSMFSLHNVEFDAPMRTLLKRAALNSTIYNTFTELEKSVKMKSSEVHPGISSDSTTTEVKENPSTKLSGYLFEARAHILQLTEQIRSYGVTYNSDVVEDCEDYLRFLHNVRMSIY